MSLTEKTLEFPSLSLTNSYQYSDDVLISNQNRASIDLQWAKGSSTSLEIIVQYSNDQSNWHTEQRVVDGNPMACADRVYQFTSGGNKSISFDICNKYMRIGAKVTGTITGATLSARGMANTV